LKPLIKSKEQINMENAVKNTVYLTNKVEKVKVIAKEIKEPVIANISTIDFIAKFEGLRLKAYYDVNHFSIWYGTRSFKGEIITKKEAEKRMIEYLWLLRKMVDKECYNENQKTAMISFMYNVGKYPMNINKYVASCDKKSIRYIMWIYWYSSNWKRLKSLVKRRNTELYLFNKNLWKTK